MRGQGMKTQDTIEVDCHGVSVVGEDDDGFWWGTLNAWFVIGDPDTSGEDGTCDGPDHPCATPTYFEVSGRFSPTGVDFQAYLVASNFEAVKHFLWCMCVVDVDVFQETRIRRKANPSGFIHVTDTQRERLLGG